MAKPLSTDLRERVLAAALGGLFAAAGGGALRRQRRQRGSMERAGAGTRRRQAQADGRRPLFSPDRGACGGDSQSGGRQAGRHLGRIAHRSCRSWL